MSLACKLYTGNYGYRLGDTLAGLVPNKEAILIEPAKAKRFSIASEYLRILGGLPRPPLNDPKAIKIISNLFANHQAHGLGKRSLVVHLRVGDIIDRALKCPNPIILARKGGRSLVRGRPSKPHRLYYFRSARNIATEAKKRKVNHVVLVCGTHNIKYAPRSARYVLEIAKLLRQNFKFRVQIKAGGDPDIDAVFMAKSVHFLHADGMYSKLITAVREELRSLG